MSRASLAEAVANVDLGAVIDSLFRSKREIIQLQTLHFCFDRLYGKPQQDVSVSGGLTLTAWRPLATLTDAEVQLLETITRKLTAPASNALLDAPHNQIESKPAIEVAAVESEP